MRLSEAIRAGAQLTPPVHGPFLMDGCSCAVGSALVGALGSYDKAVLAAKPHGTVFAVSARFPLLDRVIELPDSVTKALTDTFGRCALRTASVGEIVMLMFELCCWSREAIAEWVEVQENLILALIQPVRSEAVGQEVPEGASA